MCGLGVIVRTDGEPIPDAWLDRLDARIAHRGPDGAGRFRDRVAGPNGVIEVAMVHRRLSILDHAGGSQPMVSNTGRDDGEDLVAVVFNGCIYDHRARREELAARGHAFRSDHADTEVLVHGWREWREALPDHLDGMFAYVIWDRGLGRVHAARDRFGEKPLYEGIGGPGNAVRVLASDARAVDEVLRLADPARRSDPDPGWVDAYLQLGFAWEGATVYGGAQPVTLLPTGLARDGARSGATGRGGRGSGPREVLSTLEACLDAAVAERLEADVPLGCFLSGGVDSSLVAFFAARYRADLRTFSVRMPDARYDESAHAETVASLIGTRHETLEIDPDPASDLVALIEQLGRPFGDSSILPTHWVSRAAREHVTVALSGDGADELFLGYERHIAVRSLVRGRRPLSLIPPGFAAGRHPKGTLHKLGRLGTMARDLPRTGVLAMSALFGQRQIRALTGRFPTRPPTVPPTGDPQADLRAADLGHYLPGDLLVKVDTASMAVALEVRAPFLDRELADTALAWPMHTLTEGGRRKGLLRRLARRHLPAAVVNRPKMGFAIPIGEWFRNDHGGLRAMLLDHLHASDPFGPVELDRRAVRRLVDDHLSGRREHGQRLFALLTLSIWARDATVRAPSRHD